MNLIVLLRAVGMTAEAPAVKHEELFTADDEALLADFLVRQGNQAQPTRARRSRRAEQPTSEQTDKGDKVMNADPRLVAAILRNELYSFIGAIFPIVARRQPLPIGTSRLAYQLTRAQW